jgi:hypothetical protein
MRTAAALALIAALVSACGGQKTEANSEKAASCAASDSGKPTASGAWIREQADASGMTAAYFTLCNASASPVTLTGLSTPAAGLVELHNTTRDNDGVVSMAPTGDIVIAPGESLVFEPGGQHAMLMSLTGPIKSGDASSLTLQFSDGSTLEVEAMVHSATEAASHNH